MAPKGSWLLSSVPPQNARTAIHRAYDSDLGGLSTSAQNSDHVLTIRTFSISCSGRFCDGAAWVFWLIDSRRVKSACFIWVLPRRFGLASGVACDGKPTAAPIVRDS